MIKNENVENEFESGSKLLTRTVCSLKVENSSVLQHLMMHVYKKHS